MSDDLMNEIAAAKDKSFDNHGGGRRRCRRQRREPHVEPRASGMSGSWSATPTQQALDNSPVEREGAAGASKVSVRATIPKTDARRPSNRCDDIRRRLEAAGTRMLFVTAGMGGGTGTGASPVIAKLAHGNGASSPSAIVTSPLAVEGKIRYEQAFRGIEELSQQRRFAIGHQQREHRRDVRPPLAQTGLRQGRRHPRIGCQGHRRDHHRRKRHGQRRLRRRVEGDARQRPRPHVGGYGRRRATAPQTVARRVAANRRCSTIRSYPARKTSC